MIKDEFEGVSMFVEEFSPDDSTIIETEKLESIRELLVDLEEEETESLLFLWGKYGFTSFNQGKISLIDPFEYVAELQRFSEVTDKVIPFFRTALGGFFTWDYLDDELVITYLDVHNGEYTFRSDDISYLLSFVVGSPSGWEEDCNGELEDLAVSKFPDLAEDEMVGFEPALVLGGEESEESMVKVKIKEHLHLLSEAHASQD